MEDNKIISEPCQICGDIGIESSIMTCLYCREAREHIYCARIRLGSVPDMWLCEVCRSPPLVLQKSNLVDNNTKALETNKTDDCCVLRSELSRKPSGKRSYSNVEEEICMPSLHQKTLNGEGASLLSNDTSSSKPFLAFPKKRRTGCSKRIEETKRP